MLQKAFQEIHSTQKYPPTQEHYSFSQPKYNNIHVTLAQNDEAKQAILCYTDMVNQENDLFVLYDCFSVFLNGLKQLHLLYQKQQPTSQLTTVSVNEASKDNLFWLKRKVDDAQWSGMKNIMSDKSRRKDDQSLFGDSSSLIKKSNASGVIERLRQEVGEMNRAQEVKNSMRLITGKQVQVPIISYEYLAGVLMDKSKMLLQVFQLQNWKYKSQMGFALVTQSSEQECRIQKLFIGKFYRKEQYLLSIIKSLVETLSGMGLSKISLKVNSGQSELVKVFTQSGARLKSEQILIGSIKVLTFMFVQ